MKVHVLVSLFFSFFTLIYSNPSCPEIKTGMINVHLVCHTHDDVGWLKTLDEYYYGSKKRITWVGVQYILDSVVPALLRDRTRKFIFVESAFFFRWWNQQNERMQSDVKRLLQNGQLEFIGGGWSMNDEAAAHYNAIIDQMTLGLRKLNDTFGSAAFPRIAWQIDPFGHSREQASLFAQMGMDGLFFGRLDYDDKRKRWKDRQMEMVWKGSSSLGEESWLFTGVLPNNYSPPKGFCFDLLCPDDPIMDDPSLEDYNKDAMVDKFLAAVAEQKTGYSTSNLIMTMGEDFNYVYAEAWYKNLDKLIKYVNERQENGSKVNVVYSTPSCYLDALHKSHMKWPTKTDDFFPYASDPHAFWTGYFTSRPTLKGFIRQSNNLLQGMKQMSALTGVGRGPGIEILARAMGVAQHHDAVTGTAKQHVTDDYSKRLSEGTDAARSLLSETVRILTHSSNSLPGLHDFELCPLLNISSCPPSEQAKSFVVNVYNPLARPRSSYVRIPIQKALKYEVMDTRGKKLENQIIPIPRSVMNIPGRESKAEFELVFYAENLPSAGVQQFLVKSTGRKLSRRELKSKKLEQGQQIVLEKGNLSIIINGDFNILKSIVVSRGNGNKKTLKVSQTWLWYKGMAGNNAEPKWRASGAYIFRPDGRPNRIADKPEITGVYDGPLVGEIHQKWSSWVTQVLRLYKDKNFVEIKWVVGPIPISDGNGKEIVNRLRWKGFETNGVFYTDSNGREILKRVKNKRQTWKLNSTEPISQNYYPVTSRLILKSSEGKQMAAILNDRAQGGTSLSDGEMELMVHRRLLYDDAFGVGEPLNETAFGQGLVATGSHFILHSEMSSADCDFGCSHRMLGEEILLGPILAFSSSSSFVTKLTGSPKKSSLITPLPKNIRLLTLEPLEKTVWLLRLENFFEVNESSLSGTSSVDIQNLFTGWSVTKIEELTLGGNRLLKEVNRLVWKTDSEEEQNANNQTFKNNHENASYQFKPMQIRTFRITVSPK